MTRKEIESQYKKIDKNLYIKYLGEYKLFNIYVITSKVSMKIGEPTLLKEQNDNFVYVDDEEEYFELLDYFY